MKTYYVDCVARIFDVSGNVTRADTLSLALKAENLQGAMQRISDMAWACELNATELEADRISTKPSRGVKYLEL